MSVDVQVQVAEYGTGKMHGVASLGTPQRELNATPVPTRPVAEMVAAAPPAGWEALAAAAPESPASPAASRRQRACRAAVAAAAVETVAGGWALAAAGWGQAVPAAAHRS